jgi:hypothetical protein
MSCPISVYGEETHNVELVASYLMQYEKLCLAASKEETEVPDIQNDVDADHVLSIRTKYYTADLELALNTLSEGSGDDLLSEGCECCILVVSSSEVSYYTQ